MDSTEKLGLTAELEYQHCALNHGPDVDISKIQAEDWLIIPIGDLNTQEVSDNLAIPICAECSEGLQDNDWVLLYCVECTESQWVYKPLSKLKYTKNLILNIGCLHCAKKTEKIFPI